MMTESNAKERITVNLKNSLTNNFLLSEPRYSKIKTAGLFFFNEKALFAVPFAFLTSAIVHFFFSSSFLRIILTCNRTLSKR